VGLVTGDGWDRGRGVEVVHGVSSRDRMPSWLLSLIAGVREGRSDAAGREDTARDG